jgi:putative phosphoribosyl transferase
VDHGSVFADRVDAGRRLGARLTGHVSEPVVVCGIPRGGIVVAAEVAAALGAPVRAVIARKVGAPGHPELALGAVGPAGTAVLDDQLARRVGATDRYLDGAVRQACAEVEERVAALPGVVGAEELTGRVVIVVDDGVATGATAAAVGVWLATVEATRRVLALPVGPRDTVERLRGDYDDVVVLETPPGFVAVGQWYRDFRQVSDEEVARLLR